MLINMLNQLKFSLVNAVYENRQRLGNHGGWEVIYRDLYVRDLARMGLEDTYYPTGAAANSGLLYVLTRMMNELPVKRVLEVGAGQSSLLLNAVNGKLKDKKIEIVTLEHDEAWAKRIGGQVKHKVIHAPLTSQVIGGQTVMAHDLKDLKGKFDVIIMDAPLRTKKYSRVGLLKLMQEHMETSNFLAVMDDAERGGERQSLALCREWLEQNGLAFREHEIRAAKSQRLFASGTHLPAAYY